MSLKEKYQNLSKNKKAIVLFLTVTFGLSWVALIIAMVSGVTTASDDWGIVYVISIVTPGIAAVLVKRMTEDKRHLKYKPRFRGNWIQYLVAIFVPMIAIIFGITVYFLVQPSNFDANASLIVQGLVDTMGVSASEASSVFYSNMLTTFLLAPFAQIIMVFLEELGFRGYLLPKLVTEFGAKKALIFNSLIWSVWYIPMIILGLNYGLNYSLYPFTGIALTIVSCLSIGVFTGYLTLKTGSALPACFVRSTISSIGGVGIFFLTVGDNYNVSETLLIGPSVTGIIGMSGFILIALFSFVKLKDCTWIVSEERFESKTDRIKK